MLDKKQKSETSKKYYQDNKERIKNKSRDRYHADKERALDYRLRKIYGINLLQKKRMLEKQKNKCAICLSEFLNITKACIDHNHTTGKIRKLLCNSCNRSIGLLKEDPNILIRAANYLIDNEEI